MCLAMNPDRLAPGERCASTSNRNFEGRQGKGGRTHLVSPAMAAAAAIAGHFVDIRNWEYKVRSRRRPPDRRWGLWTHSSYRDRSRVRMQPFTRHTGLVLPMDRSNVDTDQIIPKQFLKRIERTGFGQFLFFDWRFRDDGSENPDFEINRPQYAGASILLARQNFGCGSSREHAPWALADYGFRVLVAPSFADIFYNNCFQNGMLPIRLDAAAVEDLFARAAAHAGYRLSVDLETGRMTDDLGLAIPFEVDEFRRQCLLGGLDQIDLTLEDEDKITVYERAHGIA